MGTERKDASSFTIDANLQMAAGLNFEDTQSFDDAQKGFVATWQDLTIKNEQGRTVWSLVPYSGQENANAAAPPTVNPSLWRQAKLNTINGLFKVCDGIYQARAFDMSNMTIVEGTTGLIIIDPLISVECARSALQLYRDNRPETAKLDVTAVIYTHSHVDHFGGVDGIMPEDEAKKKAVTIYAPEGFLEHAVSENVYAGCAMGRRAQYMYGPFLQQDDQGQVDTGLGKGQSTGQVSLRAPDVLITSTGQQETIAGLIVTFHMTPGSEAPAEMDFFFEKYKAFCAAENATHNMHNIQTLRGANVRDALAWSKYLGEALELFGKRAQVMFASHHWPIWGQENIASFLGRQRDMYRYLNDQTLRMLNKGYTGIEIAEVFEMPTDLATDWSCRGYYGSTSHNTKAVYDKYLGWFDGDPSNLHRLTPESAAPRYVELMGGADAVIRAAEKAGKEGDYRWGAELLRHVVYADPSNTAAKNLQADMLEQMGYQAENATWRNFFLMGAQELRNGILDVGAAQTSASLVEAMTVDMIFDAIGTLVIGPAAGKTSIVMNWIISDTGETYVVRLSNGALSYVSGKQDASRDVTISLPRDTLDQLMIGQLSPRDLVDLKGVTVTGNLHKLLLFFCLLDGSDPAFPIVTPRSDARAAWSGKDHAEVLLAAVEQLLQHDKIARPRRHFGPLPRGC
ncbi:alkyl/aryl-sulfatase [Chondromyces crocatus]|uniref:Alkyl sulfatase n=1 Tax=Chondromyces crocatus TaxID=52 RepID=A0A0K1ELT4_CHOCO|nr:alkyl sulfatase dimerization domain-containing protein [Chondromyces crocatus]AKT41617.1 alkyl sulfatase [Chondromyces crocatus]